MNACIVTSARGSSQICSARQSNFLWRKRWLGITAATLIACPVWADLYVAGDFNGWNAAGNVMTDLGGGVWQLALGSVGGRHEFQVTLGDWSSHWPGSGNSWFYGDGSGNVVLTFNNNDIQDGWRGNWGRIGTSTDPGAWTAAGDWQAWNNTGNSMTPIGGGIYRYSQALAPGWYQWKAVVSGSWDSIGDDFRGINSNTTWFEVTSANPVAVFEVNALAGIERVYTTAIPEPTTFSLVALALMACFGIRRVKR